MLLRVKITKFPQTSGQQASMNSGIFTFQVWKVPEGPRWKMGAGRGLASQLIRSRVRASTQVSPT